MLSFRTMKLINNLTEDEFRAEMATYGVSVELAERLIIAEKMWLQKKRTEGELKFQIQAYDDIRAYTDSIVGKH